MKLPVSAALLVVISSLGLVPESTMAQSDQDYQRFSIAISGGASKGAYEAGLNWAILKVMRNVEAVERTTGGSIRSIEPVSIAGASAGGINTLLSGLVWCLRPESQGGHANRSDDNFFRDVWMVPDINRLLPSSGRSPLYFEDDALLSRKDFIDAADKLREKWNTKSFMSGCRVPLGVTVTRVEPEKLRVGELDIYNQRFYIPFELRVQKDNSVAFFFDPADYPSLSDPAMILMPRAKDAAAFSVTDERVLNAIMATSAFPSGFGRRRIQYCRLERFTASADSKAAKAQSAPQDKETLVCPAGYVLTEGEFADGGLFDNLPIGVARDLAELNRRAAKEPLPVTYVYLDPNRTRFEAPKAADTSACAGPNPPEACKTMEFSFFTESGPLLGAFRTARKFELYRELTSDNWALNLSELSYQLAATLGGMKKRIDCQLELPFFDRGANCATAVRRAGQLLELGYDRTWVPITKPFSVEKLQRKKVVVDCRKPPAGAGIKARAECSVDIAYYRRQLADAMFRIARKAKLTDKEIFRAINESRLSMHHDRILRVSSRGAPITGTLLGDFGAFIDLKFREYDYYVGVYDAIALVADLVCGLHFTSVEKTGEFQACMDRAGKAIYTNVGLPEDPRGRYVFARLARDELEPHGTFRFAYEPMPPEDRDMRIIHDGLALTLEAGRLGSEQKLAAFTVEKEFFDFLTQEGFAATPTADGTQPLLATIMENPDFWATELTRRFSTRLVRLEEDAKKIYKAREPEPQKREQAYTGLMGTGAYALQTITYEYPRLAWAPSTAPQHWVWRNVIPYEFAFDMVQGDLLIAWQPTWHMSRRDNLAVRGALGFAGGLFESADSRERENYMTIGRDYTRLTGWTTISGWGVTPGWYHNWRKPEVGKQDTFGFDVHVTFLKNRLRVGLGARDASEFQDTWFLTIGIADLPGLTYWLSR
ncbi:MAG: patatin-like phospholipase family protein [Pseudomonadota bacterium]|nr:MAG: patatin-like phospholipase family protein [Pseudomonadota bacterium]